MKLLISQIIQFHLKVNIQVFQNIHMCENLHITNQQNICHNLVKNGNNL